MHQIDIESDISFSIIDNWVNSNVRFALYRLPDEDEINFVVQTSEKPLHIDHLQDLSNKSGFVIAPFYIHKSSPVVIVAADIVLRGKEQINEFLLHTPIVGHTDPKKESESGLAESDSHAAYQKVYSQFLSALNTAEFNKLVLSRTFDHPRKKDFSATRSFFKACDKYPNNFVFLCNTPESGCWLGSSPELLLGGKNNHWQTVALAGTKDGLVHSAWDDKNRFEQDIVTQYMHQQLDKAGCTYSCGEPFSVKAGNLIHLKTEFEFTLDDAQNQIGKLLHLLHPSPAVCGFPKEKAFDFILHNEGYDRSYYSGFLGCLNMDGQTDLYVNLRSMKIENSRLQLYAGGGLLRTSDLESEWNETEKKLQTILSVVD